MGRTTATSTEPTDPVGAAETSEVSAPVTLESVNPEAARLVDDFVQAHLPAEPWRQQAMFRDRESLKVNLAALLSTK